MKAIAVTLTVAALLASSCASGPDWALEVQRKHERYFW